jgi:hypothetical protein
MKAHALRLVAFVVFPGLMAASAFAGPISVNNGNFYTLPGTGLNNINSLGNYSDGAGIPGWNTSLNYSDSGQWDPSGIVLGVPAGSTYIAYSNGGIISQTVTPTVVVGAVYTLTVELGDRTDLPSLGGADLLINGVQYDATGTLVSDGWSTFTATYTGLAWDIGDAITIQLTSSGDQGDFADVTLSGPASTAVTPEPGTFYLAGLGLLCACGYSLRKSVA